MFCVAIISQPFYVLRENVITVYSVFVSAYVYAQGGSNVPSAVIVVVFLLLPILPLFLSTPDD